MQFGVNKQHDLSETTNKWVKPMDTYQTNNGPPNQKSTSESKEKLNNWPWKN